ncbi:glycosyltransferase [Acidithiobacillus sp. AC3]
MSATPGTPLLMIAPKTPSIKDKSFHLSLSEEVTSNMPIQNITELLALDGRVFIREAYLNLLNREPDEHGLAYYLGRLAQGHGKSVVIAQIARSVECNRLNEIKGLKKLLDDDKRSRSWLFRVFGKKSRIESILERNNAVLGKISESLQSTNAELINIFKELNSDPNKYISLKETNRQEEINDFDDKTVYHEAASSDLYLLRKKLKGQLSKINSSKIIFIDITTLLKWTRPPVGIVRTLFELVQYSLRQTAEQVEYYTFNNTRDRLKLVERDLVESLLYVLENSTPNDTFGKKVFDMAKATLNFTSNEKIHPMLIAPYEHDALSPLFNPSRLLAKSIFCPFHESDIVISIGLDWENSNYELLHGLKQIHGFKFIGAFYDGIPISNPEYLPNKNFCGMFFDYFCKLSELSDKIFTISDKSKKEYLEILKKEKIHGTKNINYIRLGDPELTNDQSISHIKRNIRRPFVIYVSTIEKRKNHILLLQVWKELHKKLGANTPMLICIGMWGWGVDDVKNEYQSNEELKRFVKFFDDVNNDELKWFYKNARFAVFPSHNEGWGLGASESLTYSLPCITSSTPALLEATQHLMPYCDPNDQEQWLNTIEKMTIDDDYIQSLKEIARERYAHRTWESFSEELIKISVGGVEK